MSFLEIYDLTEQIEYLEKIKKKDILKELNWSFLLKNKYLSESFFERYKDEIFLKSNISEYKYLTNSFMTKHADKINWEWITDDQIIDYKLIIDNEKYITKEMLWKLISKNRVSIEIIEKYISLSNKKDINWTEIAEKQELSEKFIEKYNEELDKNWSEISFNQEMSEEFILKHKDEVVFFVISKYDKLSEKFIKENLKDSLTKNFLLKNKKLSEGFINEIINSGVTKFEWGNICEFQDLSEEFIKDNMDIMLDYNFVGLIIENQKLSEKFMERYYDDLKSGGFLSKLVIHQDLSEEFLRKHINNLNLEIIFRYQDLSDKFIENHIGYLKDTTKGKIKVNKISEEMINMYIDDFDLEYIVKHIDLSKEFIEENMDNLNMDDIISYQKISEEFIEEYREKININLLLNNKKIDVSTLKIYKNELELIKSDNVQHLMSFGKNHIKQKDEVYFRMFKIFDGDTKLMENSHFIMSKSMSFLLKRAKDENMDIKSKHLINLEIADIQRIIMKKEGKRTLKKENLERLKRERKLMLEKQIKRKQLKKINDQNKFNDDSNDVIF